MCDQQRLRPACAYAQTDQSLCLSLAYSMTVELLTEHCLEFLCLTGGCISSFESTLVKMSDCWKSHAAAHLILHKANNALRVIKKLTDIISSTSNSSIKDYLITTVILPCNSSNFYFIHQFITTHGVYHNYTKFFFSRNFHTRSFRRITL